MDLTMTTFLFGVLLANLSRVVTGGNYSGPLAAAKIGAFTNNITPNAFTVLADLTECTFTGYAEGDGTPWGTALDSADGSLSSLSPVVQFTASGTPTPEVISGIFLTDGATPPKLLAAAALPQPVPINTAGDGLALVIRSVEGPSPKLTVELL